MSRSRRVAVVAALASVVLALTACTGNGDGPEPGTSSPSGQVDPDATLTVGLVLEPTNLDIKHTSGVALEQVLIDNVYEGLVTRSGNEVVPRLAESYDISADALTYTFVLREGVVFHKGEELTAEDVVDSLETVRTDESMHAHADLAGVESVTAVDETTVEITLAEPNIDFLYLLSGRAGLVFHKGDETDLKTDANGTGPFTFTRWAQGSSIALDRFDDYWGDPAGVGGVVFEYIDDANAHLNAALDGSVDVAVRLDPTLVSQLEGIEGIEIVEGRTTSVGTLAFNNAKAPLNDPRVREALRLAIDHEALVDAVGAGQSIYSPIPELDPGHEDLSALAPHDPTRAMELLAEAGQENLELRLTIPNHYSTSIARVLVSDLAKVGVTLSVNVVEFATWLEDVYTNKDYELSYVEHAEPRDFANYANPNYYFGYDSAQVQGLYAQALAQSSPEAASELLAQAARIVAEDHAADWLITVASVNAQKTTVHDFPHDLVNSRIDVSKVTITEG